MNPFERTWLVVFFPTPWHWMMRLTVRRSERYHVYLLTSAGHERWLLVEWSLQGILLSYLSQSAYSRSMAILARRGGVLRYHVRHCPPPRTLRALLPMNCVCFVRAVLGLPPSWRFLQSPKSLWSELKRHGAETLLELGGKACDQPVAEGSIA